MIRILLIEDDLYIQQALQQYITIQKEFELLGAYFSAEEFDENPLTDEPDIVILDINLPGRSGIEMIPQMKTRYKNSSIMMLSVNNDNESVFRSLQSGADGYLGKETPLERIKDSIIELHNGGSPITPAIARKVVDFFNSKNHAIETLNEREQQVVEGIVNGLSYKLVAANLNISIDTVRKYIKSVYRKLHINSKGELMARYHNKS